MTACPADLVLHRLLADELSSAEEAALEVHVAGCADCQARLDRLTSGGSGQPVLSSDTVLVGDGTPAEGGVLGRVADLPTSQIRLLEQEHALGRENRPTPADAPPPTGPRFTILKPHAEGGLGRVHLARDGQLGRTVALKEIRSERADDPRVRQRFLNEAEITGQLEHPGIVPVYALERDDAGRPVYAMRFIQGRTFGDAVAGYHRRPTDLGLRELLQRFISVCQTVAYAHSKGVIHRDLKPSNVMLGDYGETLVVDWGLAKRLDDPETAFEVGPVEPTADADVPPDSTPRTLIVAPGGSGHSGHLTVAGTVMGTPSYMAPEQARGEPLTPAADIYSLGAMLFTLLTGKTPHQGTTALEVLRKVAAGETPNAAGGHRALNAIYFKAMARNPQARYATAAELARDVERWLADELVSAYREPWPARAGRWIRRHRTLVASAGVAAVLLFTAGVGAVWWQTRLAQERRFEQARATEQVGTLQDRCEDSLRADDADTAAAHLDLAGRRLGEGGAETLRPRFDRLTVDLTILRDLDQIDTSRWTPTSGRLLTPAELSAETAAAFSRYGLVPGETPLDVAAGLINGSPIRERLLTALDLWLGWTNSKADPVADGLVATLQTADPDPYRGAVRDAIRADRQPELVQLGERLESLTQPTWFATVLGQQSAIPVDRREQILRAAHVRRPNDLTVLITLGKLAQSGGKERIGDAIGWYRAAVAARPGSLVAWNNLGVTLGAASDLAGAEAAFREALRHDPNALRAHANLGNVLSRRGDLDGAIAAYREAVRIDPTQAVLHYSLGLALFNRRDRAGAEVEFREAARLDPNYGPAHNGLGLTLRLRGDLDGAIAHFREVTRINPKEAGMFIVLGNTFLELGDLDESTGAYREAGRLEPENRSAKLNLQRAEHMIAFLPRLPELAAGREKPASPAEAVEIAWLSATRTQQRYALAVRLYEEAFTADPKLADDLNTGHRFAAARAAVLAASGKDKELATVGSAERDRLTGLALKWLRADLERMTAVTKDPRWRQPIWERLTRWKEYPDLATVRDPASLKAMLPADAEACQALWRDADALLATVSK